MKIKTDAMTDLACSLFFSGWHRRSRPPTPPRRTDRRSGRQERRRGDGQTPAAALRLRRSAAATPIAQQTRRAGSRGQYQYEHDPEPTHYTLVEKPASRQDKEKGIVLSRGRRGGRRAAQSGNIKITRAPWLSYMSAEPDKWRHHF